MLNKVDVAGIGPFIAGEHATIIPAHEVSLVKSTNSPRFQLRYPKVHWLFELSRLHLISMDVAIFQNCKEEGR